MHRAGAPRAYCAPTRAKTGYPCGNTPLPAGFQSIYGSSRPIGRGRCYRDGRGETNVIPDWSAPVGPWACRSQYVSMVVGRRTSLPCRRLSAACVGPYAPVPFHRLVGCAVGAVAHLLRRRAAAGVPHQRRSLRYYRSRPPFGPLTGYVSGTLLWVLCACSPAVPWPPLWPM